MSRMKKLALDAIVAAVVWAGGLLVFHAMGWWEDRSALVWVPLTPIMVVMADGKSLGVLLWRIGVLLLPVMFSAQFIGRRGWGWTVAGALAVALWFAVGIFFMMAMVGLHGL